jgi:hypothetical protein
MEIQNGFHKYYICKMNVNIRRTIYKQDLKRVKPWNTAVAIFIFFVE